MQFERMICRAALGMSLCAPLAALDLKNAAVVTPQNPTLQEKTAVTVLVEEVFKRTQIKLPLQSSMPASGTPAILVGTSAKLSGLAPTMLNRMASAPSGEEGFRAQVLDGNVVVAGNDARGMLFGVGYLLRNLRMERGRVLQTACAQRRLPAFGCAAINSDTGRR